MPCLARHLASGLPLTAIKFLILLTVLNAYVFSLRRLKRLHVGFCNHNFIPKVSFWPVLLWVTALATVFELGPHHWG